MKCCVLIPCFNHPDTVAGVVRSAQGHGPVLVVDDGSSPPLPALPDCTVIRLPENRGKGAALRAGFQAASDLGCTHAITMDADGQHFAEDLPKFLAAAAVQPEALAVGVRDFVAAGAPAGRRRSNAFASFWFRTETGLRLGDTQCGFRCYPLALARALRVRSERYAYEMEFMVRAAWTGAPVVGVPVRCSYRPEQVRQSHFRPVVDFVRITNMNIGLVLQSWVVPRSLRADWSRGIKRSIPRILRDFFTEHADSPPRLAGAVGLGLFCGIAPIWGFQMATAAVLAHWLRLNKPVALLVSNISIPPMMPFILFGGLALGHWVVTREALHVAVQTMTREQATAYLGQWLVGSLLLAVLAAVLGAVVTFALARALRRR